MANVMQMKQVKNSVSRNGFDLSTKRNFTAKVGELLPVWTQEVIPGDKISIDLKAMCRTMPLNTSAFARIREYYDFFYVPYSLLWNRANVVLSQMNYNQQHALGITQDNGQVYDGTLPYITCSQISQYLNTQKTNDNNKNFFGYDRTLLSMKLLEYLGMGNYLGPAADGEGAPTESDYTVNTLPYNLDMNIFPLLAYQKIYADFYRDEQWERQNPSTFNVDYMTGTNGADMQVNMPLSTGSEFVDNYNWFDLRYCNWQKDMYHGLLPNQQYGDEAVVPLGDGTGSQYTLKGWSNDSFPNALVPALSTASTPERGFGYATVIKGDAASVSGGVLTMSNMRVVQGSNSLENLENSAFVVYNGDPSNPSSIANIKAENFAAAGQQIPVGGASGLSIIALRQYEFLQKWKEIAQSGDQDYKSITKRIWGVDVSNHLAEKVTYLGGLNSSIDINEVVNTNITGENAAEIAGKGVGISNGEVQFNSDGQYGFIMCIYHAMPMVDYTVDYINPSYLRVNAEDFANPVFDRVGMQPVNSASIYNTPAKTGRPLPDPTDPFNLGYAPRYVDYKTAIDLSMGAFKRDMSHWVVKYGYDELLEAFVSTGKTPDPEIPQPDDPSPALNYSFFKVNPNLLDSIMSNEVDSTYSTDQLLISSFFDVKAVRNLDVDGLPY